MGNGSTRAKRQSGPGRARQRSRDSAMMISLSQPLVRHCSARLAERFTKQGFVVLGAAARLLISNVQEAVAELVCGGADDLACLVATTAAFSSACKSAPSDYHVSRADHSTSAALELAWRSLRTPCDVTPADAKILGQFWGTLTTTDQDKEEREKKKRGGEVLEGK